MTLQLVNMGSKIQLIQIMDINELTITGVLSTDYAEVIFAHTEAISGNYSPICLTSTDKVTISTAKSIFQLISLTLTIKKTMIGKTNAATIIGSGCSTAVSLYNITNEIPLPEGSYYTLETAMCNPS